MLAAIKKAKIGFILSIINVTFQTESL
jgi:hypothetical protein